MTGATPILALPFAQGGDPLSSWPGVSEALATALEGNLFPANLDSSAVYTSYPRGVSLMTVTTAQATAGSWPEGLSGSVLTLQRSDGAGAAQFWLKNTGGSSPLVMFRSASSATLPWTDWLTVVSPGTPHGQAVGNYTFDPSSSNKSHSIAFPAGRFTNPPVVVVSGSSRDATMTATGISATGCTLNMGPESGAGSVGRRVAWIATEMNGASS